MLPYSTNHGFRKVYGGLVLSNYTTVTEKLMMVWFYPTIPRLLKSLWWYGSNQLYHGYWKAYGGMFVKPYQGYLKAYGGMVLSNYTTVTEKLMVYGSVKQYQGYWKAYSHTLNTRLNNVQC